jgi:hypothetical protein
VVGASAKCWLHLALNPRFSSEVVGSTQAVNGVYGGIAYVTPLSPRFTPLKVLYSESLYDFSPRVRFFMVAWVGLVYRALPPSNGKVD